MKGTAFFRTIKGRIITGTAGITFLIALVTVIVCFTVFQSLLNQNQIQSAQFNLQVVANNVSSDMKDIAYFSEWCRSNQYIINYLETFQDKEGLAAASREDKTLRQTAINSYDRLKEEYHNTRHYSYMNRVIISNNTSSNYLQILNDSGDTTAYKVSSLPSTRLFMKICKNPELVWLGAADDPFYTRQNNRLILPVIRSIHNRFNSDVIGWVYLSVSTNIITDYLKNFPLADDSYLYLTINGEFYRLEGSRLVASVPDYTIQKERFQDDIDAGTQVHQVRMDDGKSRTLVTRSLGEPGWYIHQILSIQQLNEQKQVYVLLISAIFLVILSLGLFLLFFLNRAINQPVAMVQKKIEGISHGDFSRDPSIEWDHEIGEIGKGINRLSREVVTLMEKRIDDEKQKKDLEYQILQSQINPHFLYNTLNSIKWMAAIQGASGIAEMTTALARLMKNVAKGTSAMICLKEELDLVKDYFLIQQYRYGGSISIEYRIESEDLYQCKVHRFSLQPIIENALFHGIEPKGSAGTVTVDVRCLKEEGRKDVLISITDNGVGMTAETIEQVLHGPDTTAKADFFRQVGIKNVNRRIQYDFGPEYGISIESQPGVYTTMKLLIPYVSES